MSMLKYAVMFAMYTQTQTGEPLDPPTLDLPPVSEQGLASWYGNGDWHGSVTANGEHFDPYEYTCAHRTLPFDTVILIESQRTGKRAWCRINDRGPYGAIDQFGQWHVSTSATEELSWRGILDMSIATVEQLGSRALGLRNVKLRYWNKKKPQKFDLAVGWTP